MAGAFNIDLLVVIISLQQQERQRRTGEPAVDAPAVPDE